MDFLKLNNYMNFLFSYDIIMYQVLDNKAWVL